MPYGRKASGSILVYEYGCLPPTEGLQEMLDAMFLRNRLWNALVEIDRAYREKVRAVFTNDHEISPLHAEIESVNSELEAVRKDIKSRRRVARTGTVDDQDLRRTAMELRERRRLLANLIREKRRALREKLRPVLDQIERERVNKAKEAMHSSGLWWCNYEEVYNSYELARVKAMKSGGDLRFHKWDGTGKVTVRFQKGLPVDQIFTSNRRVEIDPVPPEAWTSPSRAVRRKLARTKVRLRIGSQGRSPVWLVLPMVMHRPLPENGMVRSASVIREKVGLTYRYRLVITVATPHAPEKRDGPVVGIDLGWRLVSLDTRSLRGEVMYDFERILPGTPGLPEKLDGIRVAYWTDEQGNEGQLILSMGTVSQFTHVNNLRSIRDRKFNEVKEKLASWMRDSGNLPDWLVAETQEIEKWRSQRRLIRLINRWDRFPGDEEIYQILREWLKKEIHLYSWEANLLDQLILRRREIYRRFAARIAQQYGTVVLEEFDLRGVARNPAPEDGTSGSIPPDRQRVIVSPSILRNILLATCHRNGVSVVHIPAQYTTLKCHTCGNIRRFNAAAYITRTCTVCGAIWDQDYNAAKVLLQRFYDTR